jgi:small ligand-binding sensory domain FIST
MRVLVGAGLSLQSDPFVGGIEAARVAGAALAGVSPDVMFVFASGAHLLEPEATLAGIYQVLDPQTLVGCGAGGVLGAGRELESGTAVAVWAASFGDGAKATPFHATGGTDAIDGLPDPTGASGVIMLSDPYSFPTEQALARLSNDAAAVPVLGGIASARSAAGGGVLFDGERVRDEGAVGVTLEHVEVLPCVSQGAAPLGREVTITAAEGNVIHELAGRPALETIETIISALSPRERALLETGVLIGIVIDSGKPEYEQGDFLVRGVLGADPDSGRVAVGATVREGQVVRLHARDAKSAAEDLRRALKLRVEALSGASPAGALVFSCNGRGRTMFGTDDHDAKTIERELGGVPAAGFFAAGEIGPVGGRAFLHGFTATLAVFPA